MFEEKNITIISSPIRRNRGAYVITPALASALASALAYALPAWSNLCVQVLFSDTVYYAVALKLHTLIQGHKATLYAFLDLEFWSNLCVQDLFSDTV